MDPTSYYQILSIKEFSEITNLFSPLPDECRVYSFYLLPFKDSGIKLPHTWFEVDISYPCNEDLKI